VYGWLVRVLVCGVGRPFRARVGVGRGDPGRCPGLPWCAPLGRLVWRLRVSRFPSLTCLTRRREDAKYGSGRDLVWVGFVSLVDFVVGPRRGVESRSEPRDRIGSRKDAKTQRGEGTKA
jgi:hypothetical protein